MAMLNNQMVYGIQLLKNEDWAIDGLSRICCSHIQGLFVQQNCMPQCRELRDHDDNINISQLLTHWRISQQVSKCPSFNVGAWSNAENPAGQGDRLFRVAAPEVEHAALSPTKAHTHTWQYLVFLTINSMNGETGSVEWWGSPVRSFGPHRWNDASTAGSWCLAVGSCCAKTLGSQRLEETGNC